MDSKTRAQLDDYKKKIREERKDDEVRCDTELVKLHGVEDI